MTDQAANPDVLVTGGSGFLGWHLARRLLRDGHRVRLLVRTPATLSPELAQQCEVIQGDLAQTAALAQAVSGVRTVFHCAGNVNTWDTWEAYYEANVAGVDHLLQALLAHNPGLRRLVHVSTVDVYGFPVVACNELSETRPVPFGYGESKRLGEARVRQFCVEKNMPFAIVRPANIIGPGSPFIQRIGAALQSGVMLKVDGGRAHAGLLHVDNLVDRLLWVATHDTATGQCYNLRDAYDVTWADFVDAFGRAINGHGLVINLPFGLAMRLARGVQALYRLSASSAEPFLHPLLVNIFGRTCGHDASKIRAHSALADRVGFDDALRQSVHWFTERERKHPGRQTPRVG